MLATAFHVLFLLAIVTVWIFTCFATADLEVFRILAADSFVIGMQDIFVACMTWLVLESNKTPMFQEDHLTGELY